jgi:hypothetical protein
VSNAGERLFDPALLFRLQLRPISTQLKFGQQGWQLPAEAELPSIGTSISGQNNFATLKLAVSESGLFMSASVSGKRQLPWCRESRLEDSDGLHVWIDTRNSRDVHRATRFCHRFVFAPMGRGPKSEQPFAGWAPINRARDNSRPPPEKLLYAHAKVSQTGYELSAAVHWQALSGFDRADFPVLGFYAAVIDRELGWQSLGLGPPLPVVEDPSLWCELALSG